MSNADKNQEPGKESIRHYFDLRLPGIRRRGDQGMGRCPFHRDDRPSLSINAAKGLFYCHGRGAKGNFVQFKRRLSAHDANSSSGTPQTER
jgi:hypothetical protein